ncbi:unnamed protein product [Nyctereutes procyonoides]|uniref:(raccoon dog) hypothetical protein n=1 Tax=Nyctereutes procyonoides TaxID=34880 RepID=A0A811YY12_NYCPR|nr:unnamed protein product [Nyctereutes procyonoides]
MLYLALLHVRTQDACWLWVRNMPPLLPGFAAGCHKERGKWTAVSHCEDYKKQRATQLIAGG